MACPGKKSSTKKRKRLPSINPFFHFLKWVWKKFPGCKKSVVLNYAVKKWSCMSQCEKQPFYDAALRAQRLHRRAKRCAKPKCPSKCPNKKKKRRMKSKCGKKRRRKPKDEGKCCSPCSPEPEAPEPSSPKKKKC